MPDVPTHKKVKTVRNEWVIGRPDRPTDAKNFRFGLHHIYQKMDELEVDFQYDDAFYVKAGEGGEIILYIEKEK